jgi:hypothetical protein
LVKTVHELRRKPVGTLGAEDLRVLLLQRESIDVLVPVALSLLEEDPLAEGDFYPGDLLTAVLKLPQAYWPEHPAEFKRASAVVERIEKLGDLVAPPGHVRRQIIAFRAGTAG